MSYIFISEQFFHVHNGFVRDHNRFGSFCSVEMQTHQVFVRKKELHLFIVDSHAYFDHSEHTKFDIGQ